MKNNFTSLIFIFTFILLTSFLNAQRTLVYCGGLIDGVSDEVKKEQTLILKKGRIVSINPGYLFATQQDRVIDLKSEYVLPGLMDMHVHIESEYGPKTYLSRFTQNEADVAFRAAQFAERTINAGFTTVRDLGGTGVNVALRDAIAKGVVTGPRIFTACKTISITGGHGDQTNGAKNGVFDFPGPERGVADGPDECRKAVRQQVKNGADLIKITATGGVLSMARDGSKPQFTTEEIKAIIETAKDFGITVAAHAHGDEGMQRAVKAGITSIEHGTMMSAETMTLMNRTGTWLVPTISAGKSTADSAKIDGFFPEMVRAKALAIGPLIQETFGKAYKAGVPIAFGTDAGVFPHGKNAKEFVFMVEAGMPEMEAIKSATMNAARLLGIHKKLGSIAPGKIADLIAVPANPLNDISILQKVSFVMKEGEVIKAIK